jgi:hypothetical protein
MQEYNPDPGLRVVSEIKPLWLLDCSAECWLKCWFYAMFGWESMDDISRQILSEIYLDKV